jgi:hypothetical protein
MVLRLAVTGFERLGRGLRHSLSKFLQDTYGYNPGPAVPT